MHLTIFFFEKGNSPSLFMQKILIKQIGKYYKKSRKYPEVVYQLKKRGKQVLKLLQKNVKIGFGVGGYPGFWTVPPGMIYDENILMLYWWFAICVIYVMEFEDNLEFLQIEILTRLTWLIHTSVLPSKWNLYPKIPFLA